MLSHHIQHDFAHPNQALIIKKQRHELYVAHSISRFALSLIGIFIPIYLLTLSYSVVDVFLFYAVMAASMIPFSFLVGAVSNKLGIKHTMLIWLPAAIAFLVALYSLDNAPAMFYPAAIIAGFKLTFYWLPLHSLFARSSDDAHEGSEVAKLHATAQIATIAAPFIGGLIIASLGFKALFLVALILILASAFPLFATPEIRPHTNLEFKHGIAIIKKFKGVMLGTAALSANEAAGSIIWPVFVYVILQDTASIGVIGTLLGAGYALFALVAGKISDTISKKRLVRIGAIAVATTWLLRYLTNSETMIYVSTFLFGGALIVVAIPFMAEMYSSARKSGSIDEFIVFREIPVTVGRIFVLCIALLVVEKIELSFLAAGLVNLLFFMF